MVIRLALCDADLRVGWLATFHGGDLLVLYLAIAIRFLLRDTDLHIS